MLDLLNLFALFNRIRLLTTHVVLGSFQCLILRPNNGFILIRRQRNITYDFLLSDLLKYRPSEYIAHKLLASLSSLDLSRSFLKLNGFLSLSPLVVFRVFITIHSTARIFFFLRIFILLSLSPIIIILAERAISFQG